MNANKTMEKDHATINVKTKMESTLARATKVIYSVKMVILAKILMNAELKEDVIIYVLTQEEGR